MTTKTKYQVIESQLKQWRDTLTRLKEELSKTHVDTRVKFEEQINSLDRKYHLAEQQLKTLKSASGQQWDTARSNLDSAMLALQAEFSALKKDVEKKADLTMGWAEGMAKKWDPKSIGWAEGMSKDKSDESIGWAEGQAEDEPVESVGWGEGYKHQKSGAGTK